MLPTAVTTEVPLANDLRTVRALTIFDAITPTTYNFTDIVISIGTLIEFTILVFMSVTKKIECRGRERYFLIERGRAPNQLYIPELPNWTNLGSYALAIRFLTKVRFGAKLDDGPLLAALTRRDSFNRRTA